MTGTSGTKPVNFTKPLGGGRLLCVSVLAALRAVYQRYPAVPRTSEHRLPFRAALSAKRMAQGVTAMIAHSIPKNIDDLTTAPNANDRRTERAVRRYDVPQRPTITAAWDLPFGRQRHFFGNASRAVDLAIRGWQTSTFNTFQSGFPLASGLYRGTLGAGGNRPNAADDPMAGIFDSITSRPGRYFNANAFTQPPDYGFRNLTPYVAGARGSGINNINLTLSKSFPIVERLKFELQASSYNLLNHPVFSSPNTTFGDASFGRISSQANSITQTEFAMKLVF